MSLKGLLKDFQRRFKKPLESLSKFVYRSFEGLRKDFQRPLKGSSKAFERHSKDFQRPFKGLQKASDRPFKDLSQSFKSFERRSRSNKRNMFLNCWNTVKYTKHCILGIQ